MVKPGFCQRPGAQAACLQCWFLGRWADISNVSLQVPQPASASVASALSLPPLAVPKGISASGAGWKSQGKISVAAWIQTSGQEILDLTVRQKFSGCRISFLFVFF